MIPLTSVSLGIGLDLVAECVAHTPGGIALLRRGALAGLLWHGLATLRLCRRENRYGSIWRTDIRVGVGVFVGGRLGLR